MMMTCDNCHARTHARYDARSRGHRVGLCRACFERQRNTPIQPSMDLEEALPARVRVPEQFR